MTDDAGPLDTRLAKALSHPLRQRLLMAYTDRVVSPSQVASELGASLGDVSYHTKQLVAHGCLELVEAVRGRGGVKHYYRATVPYMVEDESWRRLPSMMRDRVAEPVLAEMVDALAEGAARGAFGREDVHLTWVQLRLDAAGASDLARRLRDVVAAAERLDRTGDRGTEEPAADGFVLALAFFPAD